MLVGLIFIQTSHVAVIIITVTVSSPEVPLYLVWCAWRYEPVTLGTSD